MIDSSHLIVSTDNGFIRHIYNNSFFDDTLVDPLAIGYPVVIFDFDFLDSNEGFGSGVVNGFSAVIHTMDNGLTWDVRATSGFLYLYMHKISFINSMIGGAIEIGPAMGEKIVFTSDGGYTWLSGYWPFFQDMRINTLDFSPSGLGLVIGESGNIYGTNNGGLTWDTIFKKIPGSPYGLKIKIVNDSVAYMAGDEGIYKITNFATSIQENNINTNSFSIYPSPCNGKFTLSVAEKTNKSKSIYIYTTAGNLIYKKENIIDNIVQVDLSSEARGIYFVKVVQQNNVMVGKVVVE